MARSQRKGKGEEIQNPTQARLPDEDESETQQRGCALRYTCGVTVYPYHCGKRFG